MSAVDAARQALDRITAYDAVQPQAWIARFSDEAVLAAAAEVDRRAAAGEVLPLAGLTFAVKDNIDLAGLPTTAACPAFAYSPGTSATVVARLLDAGAVAVGKTNLDQFATGLVGTRSPHGAPACVFNRDYVSGGSSSGSAVAVAAGLVDFALGTDTAGSGRVPAAFNGLVGFKPSRGRWSTQGLVPACRSLDCISVFTPDAALALRVDAVLADLDPGDDFSRPTRNVPLPARPRYGVPRVDQLNFLGDSESAALYRSALKRLDGDVVEVDIAPLLEAARLLYAGPFVAERTAAMKDLLARNATAVHPVVRAIVQAGAGLSAVEAYEGQYALAACARAAEAIWSAADVLVLPTTGTIYRIAEVLAEPFALNANLGLYTNFVNLLDLSAVAVPAGFRANGTGFGISLIAPAWTDAALLDLAGAFATTKPSPGRPPLDLVEAERGVKLCVVGAHLHGMPLHWQLTSRNARLVARTRTAPCYRLYAMAGSTPPKPALVHDETGGSLEVEVYELGVEAFGSFTVEVPAPLAIGTVTLEDGSQVKGFVAEPRAMTGAQDITHLGGWRAYIASL
ncbi:MAG: allophanate hydrolase [Phenylobacterium sp.]|uniref:allophanate hydrolase n=2 Tax=Phenylobacterium sp. TaxID=1871053 RepID=UPI0025D8C39B|nr:allophanate hydrolase [Phenylobacterium sp.]MCA6223691.1 allophanate hydrolase [Phenylobacterium sp.]MCA6227929.1 allophanate hydrolase [Phenylobacterium sp.]MCA6231773.1 allophanate hydrolase [Phenylobacterium sp.]MCA6235785.1 allophanate hydrolase [Phenylobacterium sp.]MCA6250936.1 allophanate hydrolase [Phenylobacterium sp.]